MKLLKQQGIGLCLVIGMLLSGLPTILAQDIAKAYPSSSHKALHAEIKPLTVGDKVPDLLFRNVLNYKSKTAKLSDFKGKLIILDMWSTWCTSCLASFPKMEALQKKFPNKLQVLLVNPYMQLDPEAKIKTTLDKLKKRTNFYPALPIPIHDTILNEYFPHESVPHQVWIDASGKVIAITGSTEATEANIKAVIDGEDIDIPVKNDWAYDKDKPLLVNDNGGDSDEFLFRSIFTKYLRDVQRTGGIRINSQNNLIGIYYINKPLRQFVNEAYSELFNNIPISRIILDVKNPEQYGYDGNPSYAYCYDLTIPPIQLESRTISQYLREDLKRYFNISVYKEQRKSKCFVVKAFNKLLVSKSRFDKPDFDLQSNSAKKYIHCHSVAQVIKLLDRFDTPLIDEADSEQKIDIDFPENFPVTNFNSVIRYLEKIGFSISEEERVIGVVIISDK